MIDLKKRPRYSVIPSRAVYDRDLKPSALRVLGALGVHADNDGWCFPQQSTLADDLGYDRARVSHAIVVLVERGYVACELRVEKGKGMRGLWYRVILDTPGRESRKDLDTRPGGGVRKSAHRDGAEQNGESGPVCAKTNTGAGVRGRATPVCAKAHTGYIDEQSQENGFPLTPPQAGDVRVSKKSTRRKAKRRKSRTAPAREPREFVDAWNAWTKPGSSRAASLRAWRAHRANGALKLAAVRAYLASKPAQAENGRYVPYMQRWLTQSLGSFVEVAQRVERKRAEVAAQPELVWEYDRKTRTAKQVPKQRAQAPSQ